MIRHCSSSFYTKFQSCDQGWGRLQKPDYDYSAHKIIDYDYSGDCKGDYDYDYNHHHYDYDYSYLSTMETILGFLYVIYTYSIIMHD